ncbi:MAG: hypothetical protein KJP12_02670, partial [Acidimicrobiia bacterium]|nr:hypothetical protein [Acidimicrobiia bacterium]
DPGGLPGFSDGLAASVGFLGAIGSLLILLAGAVLPLLVLSPLAWFVVRWLRNRRDEALEVDGGEPAVI